MKSLQLLITIATLLLLLQTGFAKDDSLIGTFVQTTDQGRIKLVVDAEHYKLYMGEFLAVGGNYEVTGDTIKIADTQGEMACPAEAKGIYTWKIENNELVYSLIDDACTGRGQFMVRAPWVLQE